MDVALLILRHVTIPWIHFAGKPRKIAEVHVASIGSPRAQLMGVQHNTNLAQMMMNAVTLERVVMMVNVVLMDGVTLQLPQIHLSLYQQHLYQ